MKVTKYRPFSSHVSPASLHRWIDDFGGRSIADFFDVDVNPSMPATNVSEDDQSYHIDIAAPGLDKNDFQVELNDHVLTISAKREEDTSDGAGVYKRREFNYQHFSRSFHLSDDIEGDKITADYDKGILHIRLAKKEDAQAIKRTIEIG